MKRIVFLFLVAVLSATSALAVEPDEVLDDPVLEARAREISKNLRCVVCQNQSIDESNADLARDLRILVRERLVAGDSDQEVIDFVVARYGDFVLLNPPMKGITYALWFGPIGFAGIAGLSGFFYFRHRSKSRAGEMELSDAEKMRLAEILKSDG